MNDVKITHLDPYLRKPFLISGYPAHRIIAARELHRSYHEHPIQPDFFAEAEAIVAWSTVTCARPFRILTKIASRRSHIK